MPVIVKLDAKASSPVIVINEFIVCVASTKVRLLAPKESSACVVTIASASVVLPGPAPVKAVGVVVPTLPPIVKTRLEFLCKFHQHQL